MKKIKIIIATGEKNYTYSGIVMVDSNGWITINNEKNGIIKLNKNHIVSIQELEKYGD